jgi:hypothetical protein
VSRPFCAALRVAKSLLVERKVAQKLWSVILQKTGTPFLQPKIHLTEDSLTSATVRVDW